MATVISLREVMEGDGNPERRLRFLPGPGHQRQMLPRFVPCWKAIVAWSCGTASTKSKV
jgi:hypothetical protein